MQLTLKDCFNSTIENPNAPYTWHFLICNIFVFPVFKIFNHLYHVLPGDVFEDLSLLLSLNGDRNLLQVLEYFATIVAGSTKSKHQSLR